MLSLVFSCLILLPLTFGDHLILQLSIVCPERLDGNPNMKLVADVPANGSAKCMNGDKVFVTTNGVVFTLTGTFDQFALDSADCLFYMKRDGDKTIYFLDVVVGHGDSTSVVITNTGFKTLNCEYHSNGTVVDPNGVLSSWTPIHNGNNDAFGIMTSQEMEVDGGGDGIISFGEDPDNFFSMFHDDMLEFGQEPEPEPEEFGAPIIELLPACPESISGKPELKLRTDVPAYALALCKNGGKQLTSTDHVHYSAFGSFNQKYSGVHCLFHKKNGSNTYTVDVEVGWGETGSEVIDRKDITTVTCAYDDHGNALTNNNNLSTWFLAPLERQSLLGKLSRTAKFDLKVVDVLGKDVGSSHISIGKKIRLKAVDAADTVPGFRVLSCDVKNKVTNFAILRAGCGDGRVFPKTSGFFTEGKLVFSPYFDAFKLRGDNSLQFNCTVTICKTRCDGSSCPVEDR